MSERAVGGKWAVGVVVTTSGLEKAEKLEAQRRVKQAGGDFSPNLSQRCTHVISKPGKNSLKLDALRTNPEFWPSVRAVINLDWLFACEQQAACLPPGNYALQGQGPDARRPLANRQPPAPTQLPPTQAAGGNARPGQAPDSAVTVTRGARTAAAAQTTATARPVGTRPQPNPQELVTAATTPWALQPAAFIKPELPTTAAKPRGPRQVPAAQAAPAAVPPTTVQKPAPWRVHFSQVEEDTAPKVPAGLAPRPWRVRVSSIPEDNPGPEGVVGGAAAADVVPSGGGDGEPAEDGQQPQQLMDDSGADGLAAAALGAGGGGGLPLVKPWHVRHLDGPSADDVGLPAAVQSRGVALGGDGGGAASTSRVGFSGGACPEPGPAEERWTQGSSPSEMLLPPRHPAGLALLEALASPRSSQGSVLSANAMAAAAPAGLTTAAATTAPAAATGNLRPGLFPPPHHTYPAMEVPPAFQPAPTAGRDATGFVSVSVSIFGRRSPGVQEPGVPKAALTGGLGAGEPGRPAPHAAAMEDDEEEDGWRPGPLTQLAADLQELKAGLQKEQDQQRTTVVKVHPHARDREGAVVEEDWACVHGAGGEVAGVERGTAGRPAEGRCWDEPQRPQQQQPLYARGAGHAEEDVCGSDCWEPPLSQLAAELAETRRPFATALAGRDLADYSPAAQHGAGQADSGNQQQLRSLAYHSAGDWDEENARSGLPMHPSARGSAATTAPPSPLAAYLAALPPPFPPIVGAGCHPAVATAAAPVVRAEAAWKECGAGAAEHQPEDEQHVPGPMTQFIQEIQETRMKLQQGRGDRCDTPAVVEAAGAAAAARDELDRPPQHAPSWPAASPSPSKSPSFQARRARKASGEEEGDGAAAAGSRRSPTLAERWGLGGCDADPDPDPGPNGFPAKPARRQHGANDSSPLYGWAAAGRDDAVAAAIPGAAAGRPAYDPHGAGARPLSSDLMDAKNPAAAMARRDGPADLLCKSGAGGGTGGYVDSVDHAEPSFTQLIEGLREEQQAMRAHEPEPERRLRPPPPATSAAAARPLGGQAGNSPWGSFWSAQFSGKDAAPARRPSLAAGGLSVSINAEPAALGLHHQLGDGLSRVYQLGDVDGVGGRFGAGDGTTDGGSFGAASRSPGDRTWAAAVARQPPDWRVGGGKDGSDGDANSSDERRAAAATGPTPPAGGGDNDVTWGHGGGGDADAGANDDMSFSELLRLMQQQKLSRSHNDDNTAVATPELPPQTQQPPLARSDDRGSPGAAPLAGLYASPTHQPIESSPAVAPAVSGGSPDRSGGFLAGGSPQAALPPYEGRRPRAGALPEGFLRPSYRSDGVDGGGGSGLRANDRFHADEADDSGTGMDWERGPGESLELGIGHVHGPGEAMHPDEGLGPRLGAGAGLLQQPMSAPQTSDRGQGAGPAGATPASVSEQPWAWQGGDLAPTGAPAATPLTSGHESAGAGTACTAAGSGLEGPQAAGDPDRTPSRSPSLHLSPAALLDRFGPSPLSPHDQVTPIGHDAAASNAVTPGASLRVGAAPAYTDPRVAMAAEAGPYSSHPLRTEGCGQGDPLDLEAEPSFSTPAPVASDFSFGAGGRSRRRCSGNGAGDSGRGGGGSKLAARKMSSRTPTLLSSQGRRKRREPKRLTPIAMKAQGRAAVLDDEQDDDQTTAAAPPRGADHAPSRPPDPLRRGAAPAPASALAPQPARCKPEPFEPSPDSAPGFVFSFEPPSNQKPEAVTAAAAVGAENPTQPRLSQGRPHGRSSASRLPAHGVPSQDPSQGSLAALLRPPVLSQSQRGYGTSQSQGLSALLRPASQHQQQQQQTQPHGSAAGLGLPVLRLEEAQLRRSQMPWAAARTPSRSQHAASQPGSISAAGWGGSQSQVQGQSSGGDAMPVTPGPWLEEDDSGDEPLDLEALVAAGRAAAGLQAAGAASALGDGAATTVAQTLHGRGREGAGGGHQEESGSAAPGNKVARSATAKVAPLVPGSLLRNSGVAAGGGSGVAAFVATPPDGVGPADADAGSGSRRGVSVAAPSGSRLQLRQRSGTAPRRVTADDVATAAAQALPPDSQPPPPSPAPPVYQAAAPSLAEATAAFGSLGLTDDVPDPAALHCAADECDGIGVEPDLPSHQPWQPETQEGVEDEDDEEEELENEGETLHATGDGGGRRSSAASAGGPAVLFKGAAIIIDRCLPRQHAETCAAAVQALGGNVSASSHLGCGASAIVCEPPRASHWLAWGAHLISPRSFTRLAGGLPLESDSEPQFRASARGSSGTADASPSGDARSSPELLCLSRGIVHSLQQQLLAAADAEGSRDDTPGSPAQAGPAGGGRRLGAERRGSGGAGGGVGAAAGRSASRGGDGDGDGKAKVEDPWPTLEARRQFILSLKASETAAGTRLQGLGLAGDQPGAQQPTAPLTLLDNLVWTLTQPPEQAQLADGEMGANGADEELRCGGDGADDDAGMLRAAASQGFGAEPEMSQGCGPAAGDVYRGDPRLLSPRELDAVVFPGPRLTLLLLQDQHGILGHHSVTVCQRGGSTFHLRAAAGARGSTSGGSNIASGNSGNSGITLRELLSAIHRHYQEPMSFSEVAAAMASHPALRRQLQVAWQKREVMPRSALLGRKVVLCGLRRCTMAASLPVYELHLLG